MRGKGGRNQKSKISCKNKLGAFLAPWLKPVREAFSRHRQQENKGRGTAG